MTATSNDDFADIEDRLRRDLAPLADAILDQPATASVDPAVAAASDDEVGPLFDTGVGALPVARPARRWLVAAAVLLAIGGAAAIWQIVGGNDRVQTVPIAPGPGEAELGQWIDLPPAPDGVRARGHMVSVWTGDEALFWGGRSDGETPEAFVGGVAYNPTTDLWREIEAPEWAHPGASGVYLDGWVYLSAKGNVTRFDPDTGEEEEITLDPQLGSLLTVATDGTEVVAFGQASGGLGYQVVGPTVGALEVFDGNDDLNAGLNIEPVASGSEIRALGWGRNEYVLTLPDHSSWLFSLAGTPGVNRRVLPPSDRNERRVELVDTSNGPLVVHLEATGGGAVNVHAPVAGIEWAASGGFDDIDSVTVVGAGEWVVLLEPNRNPLLLAPPEQGTNSAVTSTPIEPPLGSRNPNAVWTGIELIVWGGNPSSRLDTPSVGGRIIVPAAAPHRETDPDPEAAEDSIGDENEFQELVRLLGELPDEQRIPTGPYDEAGNERFDYQWTNEGLWVYSRPEPTDPGPAMSAGEILLLGDWGGPILNSWTLGYFPGEYIGQIEVVDEAVYCMYAGDGGLPDSQFCRIDRATGELILVIHPSDVDGADEAFYADLYTDSGIDWRVVPAGSPGAVRPFGWLYMEEEPVSDGSEPGRATPVMVDESRLVRLDPETFDPLEARDLAATGERIFPCPVRNQDVAHVVDDLPPPVTETRQAIREAAAACDVDALQDLSGGQLNVPRKDGGRGMITLARLINLSPEAVQGGDEEGGQTVYLFPPASTGLSRPLSDALSRLYGPDGDDHLTIILEDGTWLVAGS